MLSVGGSSFRTRAGWVGVGLAIAAVLVGGGPAQGGTVGGTLERWHRVEISFQGPTHAESDSTPNPYLDYRLMCLFTGPSGQTFDVPGFFDADGAGGTSGSVWKCRFAPDEVGAWTYAASFRAGSDVAVSLDPTAGAAAHFDGDAGSFVVAASTASGEDFRAPDRGFLTNPGGSYLRFQGSGDPWLKGGPDIPENFLGYTGFDNTPSAGHPFSAHVADWNPGDPDWGGGAGRGIIGALNYIASTGGNCIYFLPMNIGGDAKDTFPTLAEQDKTHFDTSKLLQWETVFTHADALGIFLHFQLAETENGNENYHDGGTLGPERKLFYRELIARFGHHLGLEWDLGEENDYGTAKRVEFAAHLKALDPYDHPVTTHIHTNQMESFYGPLVGNDDFDITAFQLTEGGLSNGAEVEEWRERSALAGVPWVVSIDEPQTIHNDPTDEVNGYPNGRKDFLWPIYLSGGGGFEWYVQQDGGGHSFDQQIDDFRLMEVALEWTKYARDFMAAIPFDQMSPDQSLGSTTAGGTTYVLALPGVTYALYNDEGGTFSLDLTGQAGTYEVTWFDPENGTWHVGSSVVGGSLVSLGAPPFAGDAAVLVSTDPTAPVASFTATPSSGDAPLDVTFDASGSFAPGQIVSWAWDFGDGSSGQGEVVEHTFVAPGVYTVVLTITDDPSETDDASTNVVAFDPDAQTRLYIPAATAPSLQLFGNMTTSGTYAGGADPDPDADSILPELLYSASTTNSLSGGSGDEAHYTVTLPIGGTWYLYGRFLYPGTQGSNDANSFLARVDSGPALKFGNNKDHFQAWHWDGDGNVENGGLVPLSLGFLSAGVHTLVIEKREVEPVAPRIDVLYLTSDPSDVPTDEAAADALFGCVDCCEDCCVVDADCDDGNPCNGDESCQTQACVPGEAPVCGTCEACDPSTGCRADPWGGCKVSTQPLQSSLLLRHKGGPGDKLVWRWRRGEATGPADFGDPYTTDGVSFCVFDETTPAPTVFVAARAEAGGTCGAKPCWAEKSGMPLYKDSSASSSGLVRIAAKEAEAGKGVITLKGKDAGLGIPALPAPEGLLVQLRSDAGVCWETRFSAAGVLRNDEKAFKARDVPIP